MNIKVLSIGSDRKLFEEGSAVLERIKEYGALVDEYHIVVFAKQSLGLKSKQIASNVWIYPTNSISRLFYTFDAIRIGKKIGATIITTQDPFESGWVGLKLKSILKIPLEVQLHTDPFSPYFSGFLNMIRKVIARKVLRNANSVRVVTEALKDKIIKKINVDIRVLPIYVDRRKFEEGSATFDLHTRYPWKFILLTVSRLAPEKNLHFTLKILARVREKYPNTGLVVVGSGPEEESLKFKVKSLKLEKNVQFVGWQNNLVSYYKTADAFIQTSFFEGYGVSLVEAGLSGLPIITTRVGLAQDLVNGRDAYIYEIGDLRSITDGTLDLIENKDMRENLIRNIKNTLKNKLLSKEDYLRRLKSGWEETFTLGR